MRAERRYGNWSGMGAGKTLSAIVATRVVDAKLTVICCPNTVVDNWEREIKRAFPHSDVAKKTWHPVWVDSLAAIPRYLVLHYEHFQQPSSEPELVHFLERNVIDFVVVDEIHFAKQRDVGAAMSKRKRLVQGLILEAGKKSGDLCVLGMSGTPAAMVSESGDDLHRRRTCSAGPCAKAVPLGRCYALGLMRAVTIEIPENVLVGSGQSAEEFAKEAKLLLLAKLYELGRVSSGKAAEAYAMTRFEFLMAAGKLGVSPVQLDAEELKRELADA